MDVDNAADIAVDDGGGSENYFEDFAADFERYLFFIMLSLLITHIRLAFDSVLMRIEYFVT